VNGSPDFKQQVNTIISELSVSSPRFDTTVTDEGFARIFVYDKNYSLKLDFVNDVPFRSGVPSSSSISSRTDNILNILSNKVTALGRYLPKDVVDLVFICGIIKFNWKSFFNDASTKDLWINPVNASEILESFPVEKIEEIV
jgi:hypothetical protein